MTAQNRRHTLAFQMPEFLSSRDGWNDAEHQAVPPRTRIMLGRVADRFAKLRARHAAFAELHRTSDRELRDMGMTRGDIDRIFEPEFAAEHATRGALPVRTPKSGGGW